MSTIKNKFTHQELSGSFGDLGLFIPLVIAMTISAELNIGIVLIFAGLMSVLTGVIFKQPIPVQPMKALAVVVIAENVIKEELFAAGIMMGILLIVISFFIDKIEAAIPKAIVRGIQLGVGLKLLLKAVSWLQTLPFLGWDSLWSAICVAILLLAMIRLKIPGLLYIFLLGFVFLYFMEPTAYDSFAFSLPQLTWSFPDIWAFKYGFLDGVLPQLPLTLLNSVIAVCALSRDYFPDRGITTRKMAFSVGLMNLISVPFGAVPMCHGASGLAAHHRFGARTGGSVIMLGVIKIIVGLFLGNFLFTILQLYPVAILAPMLIFAGAELARQSKDAFQVNSDKVMAIVTAGGILVVNTFIGFLCGCGAYILILFMRKMKS